MSEDATLDDFAEQGGDALVNNGEVREDGFLTLPYDWSISNLAEVAQKGGLVDGDWIESADMDEDGEIQLVQLGHIGQGQFKGEPDRFITEEFAEEEDCTVLSEGDLLISRMQEPILRSCLLPSFERDSIMAVDIARLQENRDCNRHFLKYVLNSRPIWKQGIAWASGTTRKRISRKNMEKLRLPTPSLTEQRKIATVLYTVDRAVENAEEIETQLQRIKKGAKQRLFTYGLNNEDTQGHHIGDFPQSWEFDKVANLADIERGNTPRTSHDEYYGGDITWVTPDDLSDLNEDGNGKYISDSGRKLTSEGVESSSLTVIEPDSVMFTSRSYGIGRTAICIAPAATNQGITAFECGETLDTEFFYYYLNYIMDYVVSISGGSTFPEISKSATGNINVPVPEIEEQKEIASLLSQFDKQILHNREVMSQLKRFKRGLMQDLLSGTVRTTDTNIEVPEEIIQHG